MISIEYDIRVHYKSVYLNIEYFIFASKKYSNTSITSIYCFMLELFKLMMLLCYQYENIN